MTAEAALRWAGMLIGASVIVTSAELLVRARQLRPGGLLRLEIMQLRAKWMLGQRFSRHLSSWCSYPTILVPIMLRMIGGVALIFAGTSGSLLSILAALVAVFGVWIYLAAPFGHDGSDQMISVVLISIALANIHGSDRTQKLCLWFVASQACLSYASAGYAKLIVPGWRRGDFLPRILKTKTYGCPLVGDFLAAHVTVSRLLSIGIIAFECLFPLVLLAPRDVVVVVLGLGLTFHLIVAATMGLNNFTWSFAATYPAILYCAQVSG